MQPRLSSQRNAAMTLFEVGVVIAIVMVLAVLLLPALSKATRRSSKLGCTNCLKQIGLAYRIWEGDNSDLSPMAVPTKSGGAMEMAATGNVAQVFQVMSNELSLTKILVCPEDTARIGATNFAELSNSNISYFVGLDVTNDVNPQLMLSGDSNFQVGGVPLRPGLRSIGTNDPVAWMATRHINSGNIGLADGSVQATMASSLRQLLQLTGLETNHLALP